MPRSARLLPTCVAPTAGSYFVLNVLLWVEAANRHGTSEKGKALRGEAFFACGTSPCLDPNDPTAVEIPVSELLRNAQARPPRHSRRRIPV